MRALELFSGPGLMGLAAERAGFRVKAAVESVPNTARTYALNHGRAIVLNADLRAVAPEALAGAVGPIDLVFGGPPCEGFHGLAALGVISQMGEAKGRARLATLRNRKRGLFVRAMRVVAAARPRGFVFENIPGARSTRTFSIVLGLAKRLGYSVSHDLFDAADFGAPQHRRRLFLFGVGGARKIAMPDRNEVRGKTARDAIGDLGSPFDCGCRDPLHHMASRATPEMARILARTSPGQAPKDSSGHGTVGVRRVDPDSPAPSLTSLHRHFHWDLRCPRTLSLREGARLQGFPDSYRFCGNATEILHQIGDAVPLRLGSAMLRHAKSILRGAERPVAKSGIDWDALEEAELQDEWIEKAEIEEDRLETQEGGRGGAEPGGDRTQGGGAETEGGADPDGRSASFDGSKGARIDSRKEGGVPGSGPKATASLAVIGDGPGEDEVKIGEPFSGASGTFLKEAIRSLGADPGAIYYDNIHRDRRGKLEEKETLARGQERLNELFDAAKFPKLRAILALGDTAVKGLLAGAQSLSSVRGKSLIATQAGTGLRLAIFPIDHPAAIVRMGRRNAKRYRGWIGDIRDALRFARLIPGTAGDLTAEVVGENKAEPRTGSFVLQRRHWRVREVVREGPSQEFFHLRLDWGGTYAPAFLLEGDPLRSKSVIGTYEPRAPRRMLERTGTFTAEEIDDPKPKEIGAVIVEELDRGKAELLKESEGRLLVRLAGRLLSGEFLLQDQGGGAWGMIRQGRSDKVTRVPFRKFAPFIHHEERIVKRADGSEESERLIYGVVYPAFRIDAQGDWADGKAIRAAAHDFMINSQRIRLMHQENTDAVRIVESSVPFGESKIGSVRVPPDNWILVTKILRTPKGDAIWEDVKAGRLRGYSLGGVSTVGDEAPPARIAARAIV